MTPGSGGGGITCGLRELPPGDLDGLLGDLMLSSASSSSLLLSDWSESVSVVSVFVNITTTVHTELTRTQYNVNTCMYFK